MFHSSAISNRRPFAPSALPEIIARMGASDFRSPPPSSSLFRLVRRRALLPALTTGSPWLPRNLLVRLDADSDPGVASRACQCARDAVACWPIETIDQFTNLTISGLEYLQGQHHLFPLHLASFCAYASSTPLPEHLQGSIPGPWLAVTWAGFAPARLRGIAKPQPMAGLRAPLSTLRDVPRGNSSRMTRGQRGLLRLHCQGLSPFTPCRSPGALSDHLVGADQPRVRNREARRFRGLAVDKQFEFRGLFYWYIAGFRAFEDFVLSAPRCCCGPYDASLTAREEFRYAG
jgi:hypothetical protein